MREGSVNARLYGEPYAYDEPENGKPYRPMVMDGGWMELTDRLARLRDAMFYRRDKVVIEPLKDAPGDYERLAAEVYQALDLARQLRKQAAKDHKNMHAFLQLADKAEKEG